MLFLTTLDIIPGKTEEAMYLVRKVKPPERVKVHQFLKLFGKPDFAIVFEALNEEDAVDFVLKFSSCSTPKTSLCNSVEGYEINK
ncbi:MAG: hypothetical protein HY769_10385 [Candidatus Stahlbacteria bacterium]|nr:hypothetical protein [Candidatus Stahlbacteria bacterium]